MRRPMTTRTVLLLVLGIAAWMHLLCAGSVDAADDVQELGRVTEMEKELIAEENRESGGPPSVATGPPTAPNLTGGFLGPQTSAPDGGALTPAAASSASTELPPLETPINRSSLALANLFKLQYGTLSTCKLNNSGVEGCQPNSPVCPSFGPFPFAYLAQSSTHWSDATEMCYVGLPLPETVFNEPPLNCRDWYDGVLKPLAEADSPGAARVRQMILVKSPHRGCSLDNDFRLTDPFTPSVYKFRNVYVTADGLVFNQSTLFRFGGCLDYDFKVAPELLDVGTLVKPVATAVSWGQSCARQANNLLLEALPSIWSLRSIMAEKPETITLAPEPVFRKYETYLSPLLGVPTDRINKYEFNCQAVITVLADTLYQPTAAMCGFPSAAVWRELRMRHFLHPDGIPMLNPDWSVRPLEPLNLTEAMRYPQDWVVVVEALESQARSLVGMAEVAEAIRGLFPARMVLLAGSLDILSARKLFNRARLFVGAHGPGLANMLFMPVGASVLEIRPAGSSAPWFHTLASIGSLNYHLVLGDGGDGTPSAVNVTEVVETVKYISTAHSLA